GRQEESEDGLQAFIEAHSEFWAYQIAEVYAWRNETDQAFSWFEAALQYRDPGFRYLLNDPALVNLYDDPRWEPFLNKVGLLEAWQAMPGKLKGPAQ
ncbi:MAG TPA: hypothetical protein VIS57_11755, partial [Xanthomonadales bacterium]